MKLCESVTNKRTIKRFESLEDDFNKVHGVGTYGYQFVEYKNGNIKVKIVCPNHGIFLQRPSSHAKGHGCIKCTHVVQKTTKIFIKEAIAIHGNLYDYSLVDYISSHKYIKIICKVHGVFKQTPSKHTNLKHGCNFCNGKLSTDDFIRKAKQTHGDIYNYSKSIYVDYKTPVEIICKNHGSFYQIPSKHINKNGCPRCAGNIKLSTLEFVLKAQKKHGTKKYSYRDVKYENNESTVKIYCNRHDILFSQKASNHLVGKEGCRLCRSNSGFKKDKPAILYYLSINNGEAYKIGITNRSVQKRFNNYDLKKIEVLKEWYYDDGVEAYAEEQRILNEFDYFKWDGPDLLESGNTELFKSDILGIDLY